MNSRTYVPSPMADVTASQDGDRWTIVFIRDLRHPPERVWAALTEPAQLRKWAPFLADRDLSAVGDAVLTMVDGETTEDLPASVRRAEPPRVLEYTLGTDVLRWELTATGDGTRLTLRHTVGDPSMAPKVAAGWHICLDVAERLLDGAPIGPIRGRDALNFGWSELDAAYAENLAIPGTG